MPVHDAAAVGFAAQVAAYERGRPSYPPAAVAALVPDDPDSVVVEVGAGTGKFTRLLAARRTRVVAVEPVAAMRAQLAGHAPAAAAVAATAEALPFADGVAGLVVAAQAFHWFATHAALAELHRVLRPHGRLGLIWNDWTEQTSWEHAMRVIGDRHRGDAPQYVTGRWRDAFADQPWFGPLHHEGFDQVQTVSPADAVDRMASISYLAALPPDEHARVRAELWALLPPPGPDGTLVLSYRTDVFWSERR